MRHSNLVKNNLIIRGVNGLDKILNFQNLIEVENLKVLSFTREIWIQRISD